jgi:hypothetical protein
MFLSPEDAKRIFHLASVSRQALGSTQPPVQWVPMVLSSGVNARLGRDAGRLPLSSAEVVNEWEVHLLCPLRLRRCVVGLLYFLLVSA